MNLQKFIDFYINTFVEIHSYNPGALNQCVDLANAWIIEGFGLSPIIGTNAQDFPSKKEPHFNFIENKIDAYPEPGDLVIFKSADKVGHISIYVKYIHVNLFTSFDQNYPTGSPCKLVNHNYQNVLGWMRPKGVAMPPSGEKYNVEGVGEVDVPTSLTQLKKIDRFLQGERQLVIDAREERDKALRENTKLSLKAEACQNDLGELTDDRSTFFDDVKEATEYPVTSYSGVIELIKDQKKLLAEKPKPIMQYTKRELFTALINKYFGGLNGTT